MSCMIGIQLLIAYHRKIVQHSIEVGTKSTSTVSSICLGATKGGSRAACDNFVKPKNDWAIEHRTDH